MIKLKDCNYDKESGISYAEIETDIGIFYEYAFLNPEDADIESTFLGCEIAEYRATIEYFKAKLKNINIKINTLLDLQKDLKKITNENCKTYKKVCDKLKNYELEKKEFVYNIKSLKTAIENKIDNRIVIINKMKEKKQDSE